MRPNTKFYPFLYFSPPISPHPFPSFLASFFLSLSFIVTMLPPSLLLHLYLLISFLDLFFFSLYFVTNMFPPYQSFFAFISSPLSFLVFFFLFLVLCSHNVTFLQLSLVNESSSSSPFYDVIVFPNHLQTPSSSPKEKKKEKLICSIIILNSFLLNTPQTLTCVQKSRIIN